MTEAEQFAICDAYEGNTMIVFASKATALRYAVHRYTTHQQIGLMAGVEDTRGGTGLFVMWRDRIPPHELDERIANCRWLLRETLAGRSDWPKPGEVVELRSIHKRR